MADKEERLKIDYFKEDPCNNCSQTLCQRLIDTCCRLKTDYEENSIAKQEAIEVIAKRLKYEGVNKFECNTIAKWCLDALLEGVRNERD